MINVYLAGDVLIDAGRTWDGGRIRKQTADRDLSLLALTHVHPDHQGAAKAICEERGIPLACHVDDVDAMEGRRPVQEAERDDFRKQADPPVWEGPPYKVARPFEEGDEIAGFQVIHAPGHARGEVIFWRESDRVAICGDVVRNMSYETTLAGVREPPEVFTWTSPRTAARSASSPTCAQRSPSRPRPRDSRPTSRSRVSPSAGREVRRRSAGPWSGGINPL